VEARHAGSRLQAADTDARRAFALLLRCGDRYCGDRATRLHGAHGESVQRRVRTRARDLAPTIQNLQANGAESLKAIARGLNDSGVPTASGKGQWNAELVSRVLKRL
jgi:hypothetical protein